jgi:ABC-2 type transport system permease protein
MPIFDQGYQHWQGPLSGHGWRWWAIARHGVRIQMKSWILRLLLLAAWLPALALVAAVALWGLVEQKSEGVLALVRNLLPADVLLEPQNYRLTAWTLAYSFFFKVEMFFIMLLVAFVGPSLISRDLRFNALPLYLARPMTRLDYFLGKLGVIGWLVALAAVGPAVLAYAIGACFSLNLGVVKDTYTVLLGSIAFGLVITLSIGTFVLALSSLTRRSLYVGIAWAGMWIISGSVGSIMTAIHHHSLRQELRQQEMDTWLAEHPMPPGMQMRNGYPQTRWDQEGKKWKLAGVAAEHEDEADLWHQRYQQASSRSWMAAEERLGTAMRSDWRPMCSYVANLGRIGDLLLNTDAAWVQLGRAVAAPRAAFAAIGGGRSKAPPVNERVLADRMVPQYPWEWSAGVLAALLGLSTWTLSRRVKSLDRLK